MDNEVDYPIRGMVIMGHLIGQLPKWMSVSGPSVSGRHLYGANHLVTATLVHVIIALAKKAGELIPLVEMKHFTFGVDLPERLS